MIDQIIGIVDPIYLIFLIMAILILIIVAATHSAANKSYRELQKVNSNLSTIRELLAIMADRYGNVKK